MMMKTIPRENAFRLTSYTKTMMILAEARVGLGLTEEMTATRTRIE
jgi:hypothetical protein